MAVGKGKQGKQPGKSNGPKAGNVMKPARRLSRKVPTLKQKHARENKIVTGDQVRWKAVEIPDTLGDYSGFFGLEELTGVDVRMVDGKPEFVAKASDSEGENEGKGAEKGKRKAKPKGTKDKAQRKPGNKEQKTKKETANGEAAVAHQNPVLSSEENDESQDEFAGFDDLDSETTKPCVMASEAEGEDELPSNAFTVLDSLFPDKDDIDLPHWASVPLSAYTLMGLQSNGFTEPTPIQWETIPLALSGRDVIGKATTGSGKTLAYGIPILEKYFSRFLTTKNSNDTPGTDAVAAPSGIVFSPTRELAHQVVHHIQEIAKGRSPLAQNGIVSVTGGLSMQKQERLLSYGPGVVVATPGRFLELIEKNQDLLTRMAATDIVVLDEADRLLQDGHFEEFEKILELMEKFRSKQDHSWRWQTLVFSATFSREFFGKLNRSTQKKDLGLIGNDEILDLLKEKLNFKDPRPALCDANPNEIVSSQVTEALVECGATERDLYVYYFVLTYPGLTLVFANSVNSVKRLVPLLENLNIPAFSIHSAMMQKQRLRSLERFRASCTQNKSSVLIATDVAARGLDIPSIDHVAHYHLPRSADVYVHRSGRTARAGKEGVSVMFCSPREASGPLKKLRRLLASSAEKTKFNTRVDVKLLPIDLDVLSQIKARVRLAGKLADAAIVGTAMRKESSWLKEAAEDLGIADLKEMDQFEDDVIKQQRQRTQRKLLTKNELMQLRFQLTLLLLKPLRSNHRRSYITSGLENSAHQIVSGSTSDTILGKKLVKALDELHGLRNRVRKKCARGGCT